MAAPLVHSVIIEVAPSKIYEAISTGKGLASFWTRDSQAEPRLAPWPNLALADQRSI